MEREQQLAEDYVRDEAQASTTPMPASVPDVGASDTSEIEQQLEQGLGASQTDDLELCSTTELLELFEGYYETDKKQLENNFLISHTGFHVDLDLDHPALSDPGNVPRAAAPVRAEVGTGPGDCDIESLIATE